MKDLKIYYEADAPVDVEANKEFDKIAKKFGLSFQGSGFDVKKGIVDLHYKKEKQRGR